jgi:hypothetical protein
MAGPVGGWGCYIRAMNPQGWSRVSLIYPNQLALNFSQVFQLTTIQSTLTLFSLIYTTQENGPPSLPRIPLGCPPPSRDPIHLFKNIHDGTLTIHSCDKKLSHAHAYKAYMYQFMAGIHHRLLQLEKQWILSNNSLFSQPRSRMNEE